MSKIVETDKAAAAIGPYSQGICVAGMLFTSGQIPVSPESGEVVEGFEAQALQVLENLKAVAEAAGTELKKTVKTTCYLSDMSNFDQFNAIYARYFQGKPARSCVAVKTLPKNVLLEVEAIIEL